MKSLNFNAMIVIQISFQEWLHKLTSISQI